MAAQLYISLNTLKTHLHSIYRKLGVHGRSEAIERRKELGSRLESHCAATAPRRRGGG